MTCPGRAFADAFWWSRCDIRTVPSVGAERMSSVRHAPKKVAIANPHESDREMQVGGVARRASLDTSFWGKHAMPRA